MNRRILYVVLFSLLAVAAVGLWRWGPYLCSADEVSNLYRRYEHTPHIEVSYLRNFPINDSVSVGVTMLHAVTDSAWALMQKDFGFSTPPPQALALMDSNTVAVRLAPKEDYSRPIDTAALGNNDVVAIAMVRRQVCVFHVENENQIISLLHHQYE